MFNADLPVYPIISGQSSSVSSTTTETDTGTGTVTESSGATTYSSTGLTVKTHIFTEMVKGLISNDWSAGEDYIVEEAWKLTNAMIAKLGSQ